MELKKGQKQGREERTQEDYWTSATQEDYRTSAKNTKQMSDSLLAFFHLYLLSVLFSALLILKLN